MENKLSADKFPQSSSLFLARSHSKNCVISLSSCHGSRRFPALASIVKVMLSKEFGFCCVDDSYSSPGIIIIMKSMRMRWTGHIARMGEKRNASRLLVGNPKEKRPLRRPRRRWVDNIRRNIVEVGWGDVDWIRIGTGGELS
jgi:hypothetical protein